MPIAFKSSFFLNKIPFKIEFGAEVNLSEFSEESKIKKLLQTQHKKYCY
jgi:hypothetical protein